MIMKLIPQKLGNAVILMQSGLNHFWESVLNFAAVSAIYIGLKFGFLLFQMQNNVKLIKVNFYSIFLALSYVKSN